MYAGTLSRQPYPFIQSWIYFQDLPYSQVLFSLVVHISGGGDVFSTYLASHITICQISAVQENTFTCAGLFAQALVFNCEVSSTYLQCANNILYVPTVGPREPEKTCVLFLLVDRKTKERKKNSPNQTLTRAKIGYEPTT